MLLGKEHLLPCTLPLSLCVYLVCWRSLMLEVVKLPVLGF